jgi:hypothetical protein
VASRNRWNITGSGTPEKSHSAYPCEVAGGSSPAEPRDDSSSAEALGSLAAGTWRPGRALRVAALALAEATYVIIAPRKPMGKHGPETERSPVGVAVVSLVSASRCDAMRAKCRRSDRACRERWSECRQRRGAEGLAVSVLAGVGVAATRAAATRTGPAWRRAWSSSRLVRRMR